MSLSAAFQNFETTLKAELISALEAEKLSEQAIDRILHRLFAKKDPNSSFSSPAIPSKEISPEERKQSAEERKASRQSGLFGY